MSNYFSKSSVQCLFRYNLQVVRSTNFFNMSQKAKQKLLSQKLKMNSVESIKKELCSSIQADTGTESTSKYFSPLQTRNQRKNKIKVEVKSEVISPKKVETSKSSLELLPPVLKIKDEKISPSKRKLYTPDQMLDIEDLHKRHTESTENTQMKSNKWQPENWLEILQNIREMRSQNLAPVDTMGCDMCSIKNVDDKSRRYHILVALMLSSQTKDQTTHDAMSRLQKETLTPESIVAMPTDKLEKLLNPVSFYKVKSKSLQKTANILIEKYESDIPNSLEDLMKLPGVGPKMAHICMNSAWGIVSGIGVDVHVHRISNRLGWVKQTTKEPEQTRKELEAWLPFDNWKEINHLLVGFGQMICTPINPKCGDCKNQKICPSAFKVTPKKSKKK